MPTAPWFEDLRRGQVLDDAPAVTVTDGLAATHQAIVGDRLRLPLDHELSRRVTGEERPLAHPQLVCDLAIGQSTQVTQRVVANLFYRGLALHRPVRIGDTLWTVTTVEALKQNTRRAGRPPTGLAVLHMRTTDQHDRTVLDFRRCAMLPLREDAAPTGHADDVQKVPDGLDADVLARLSAGWDLDAFRAATPRGPHLADLQVGQRWTPSFGDVVTSAPELARLTLNVAGAHHDAAAAGGRRLVYGGHTIGIAAAQLARAVPNLVTIAGWERCDHTGPVHEGDTLHGQIELTALDPLETGGGLARFRLLLRSTDDQGSPPTEVLDWRMIGVMA